MAPSSQSPSLGSLAVQAPSTTPQIVHVSPSTCHDLSLFKDILREYRRLDDTIIMRLNRANAAVRDQERLGESGKGNVQDQACAKVWRELVGNWNRRMQLVDYCVTVVDRSVKDKTEAAAGLSDDPVAQRKTKASMFADEVKRNQIHNEVMVESIVRKRALQAFRSRCQYFAPPPSEAEARKVWDDMSGNTL